MQEKNQQESVNFGGKAVQETATEIGCKTQLRNNTENEEEIKIIVHSWKTTTRPCLCHTPKTIPEGSWKQNGMVDTVTQFTSWLGLALGRGRFAPPVRPRKQGRVLNVTFRFPPVLSSFLSLLFMSL